MLTVRFIVIDRTRSPFLRDGEAFYLQRIQPYARPDWVVVKPANMKHAGGEEGVREAEGKALCQRLHQRDYVIALDRSGGACSSSELAAKMGRISLKHSRIAFVIGGPLGLGAGLLRQAHERLALSRFTFTHEMARLILLEQVYRALTIQRGEKYHK